MLPSTRLTDRPLELRNSRRADHGRRQEALRSTHDRRRPTSLTSPWTSMVALDQALHLLNTQALQRGRFHLRHFSLVVDPLHRTCSETFQK